MPTIAPLTKITNCREFGATVKLHGDHILEARDFAVQLEKEQDLTYINGFDHPNIIAGAGTMATEMLNQVDPCNGFPILVLTHVQVPNADAIVVPVGGGGLIAGISLVVKALNPKIEVIVSTDLERYSN